MRALKGQWALITGATSGLGAAFARQLASEGFNLILHGRRRELLDQLAAELTEKYESETEVLIAELTDDSGVEAVIARIQAADVTLLINNAGFGTGNGFFADRSIDDEVAKIQVHAIATMRLTHAVLPRMLQKNRGAIINVSSAAAFLISPGGGAYGPSKAFLNSFTESLSAELSGTRVRLQVLCPGFFRSDFHKRIDMDVSGIPKQLWMSAEEVVQASLLGLSRNKTVVIPGWRYRVIVGLSRWLPRFLLYWIANRGARRFFRRD